MLDDFLVRSFLAGIAVALAAAPLGCVVVWRRMAFFGDATAHAAILGVALALAFSVPIFIGVVIVALAMATLVSTLGRSRYAADTLLAVLAHSALALGLVAVALSGTIRIDLMAFLFGDILAVSRTDLAIIWSGALVVLALTCWRWSAILTVTVSPDLAQAAGINPQREQLAINLGLALTVAVAIKIVGALLIAAMLIIPAAAARPLAQTPERMAIAATILSGAGVACGLGLAMQYDTPAGPSIVTCLAGFFLLSTLMAAARR